MMLRRRGTSAGGSEFNTSPPFRTSPTADESSPPFRTSTTEDESSPPLRTSTTDEHQRGRLLREKPAPSVPKSGGGR